MSERVKFTKHQKETAIMVLMQSSMGRHWVESRAQFLEIDLSTPKGQEFYEREARAQAEKLIK